MENCIYYCAVIFFFLIIQEVREFASNFHLSQSCVVKPTESAAQDNVFLLKAKEGEDIADLAVNTFRRIFGVRNALGTLNESVLIQV